MAEPAEQLALPFPVPTDTDFDEDISTEERAHYTAKYKDLNDVKSQRLHCTACDKHLGCAAKGDGRMRTHPMLRTLVCRACHTFYNSGEFERGDDGSELYCRWCGQGGQVYCCSACPHVFCAKCIKRNLGQRMIREIESTDDWKCFKCSPRELWDLRSTCWALLRYCDLKNKLAYVTQEPDLKEKYQKECAIDDSECCKNKKRTSTPSGKKREVKEVKEIKEIKEEKGDPDKNSIISKIPSGIQVKKFACVNVDNILKAGEKKPVKRPAEVLKPVPMRAPIPIAPYPKPVMPTMSSPGPGPMSKKFKIAPPGPPLILNHQMPSLLEPKKYQRNIVRPRIPILNHPSMALNPMGHGIMSPMGNTTLNNSPYNGYNNFRNTDNINLSLESLTQGLDMTALATTPGPSDMNQLNPEDDVVCTPDFPLEPLCEVTEDTNDDDVQCITPAPIAGPKPPPLLTPRPHNTLPDLTPENIVQMTDNDVTVNAHTGGLKFRVDPQTLSSNKMYRLPDGRIFAINANPNMPGGYSATIVAVSDQNSGSSITAPPHGATYAAKLSAVVPNATPLPSLTKLSGGSRKQQPNKRTNTIVSTMHKSPQGVKITKVNNNRSVDMKTPVEWYRYNLIEAVDSLGYSLTRLNRLKKEADSRFLRSRTIEEMRQLHRTLEQLLKTSTSRFQEVRDNLNRGFKDYLRKKGNQVSDDDDDVEILPEEPPAKINLDDSDDAIFIDENSVGSEAAGESADNQEESSSYPERIKAIATINTDNHDSGDLDGIKEPEDTDKTDPLAELSEEAKKDSNYKENKTAAEENTEIDNTKGAESEIIDTVAIKHSEDTQSEKKDKLVNEEEQTKAAVGVPSEKKQSVDSENVVDDSETTQMNKSSDDTDTLEKDVPNSSEIELRSPSGKEVPNPLEKEISNPSEKEVPNLSEKEVSNSSLKEVKQVNSEKHIPDSTDNDDQADEENEECILGDVLTRTGTSIDSEDVVTPEVNPDNEDSNDKKNKVNGSLGTKCDEAMEVDMPNSVAEVHSKNTDNDLQMSDEMIDNLLADDVNTDELTADLQKLTEHSLESLAETDLVASDFK